jgi:hypothetical protein
MTSVVVTDTTQTVVVTEGGGTTVVTVPSAAAIVQVSTAGPQGPAGPVGPPGTSAPVTPVLLTQQVIAENYTLTAGYNGVSAGDVDVAATYTVTVPSGATWVIV